MTLRRRNRRSLLRAPVDLRRRPRRGGRRHRASSPRLHVQLLLPLPLPRRLPLPVPRLPIRDLPRGGVRRVVERPDPAPPVPPRRRRPCPSPGDPPCDNSAEARPPSFPTAPGRPATIPATSRWTGAVGCAPPRATRRSCRPTGWDCSDRSGRRSRLDASTRERPSPSAASSSPATLEATSRDQTQLPPATATRPGSTTPSPAPPARRSAGNPPRSPVSVPRRLSPSAGRSPPRLASGTSEPGCVVIGAVPRGSRPSSATDAASAARSLTIRLWLAIATRNSRSSLESRASSRSSVALSEPRMRAFTYERVSTPPPLGPGQDARGPPGAPPPPPGPPNLRFLRAWTDGATRGVVRTRGSFPSDDDARFDDARSRHLGLPTHRTPRR